MYKLYWSPDTGSLAPQILLEEIGAEHELIEIDLEAGEETEAAYLEINPRGQVPTLILPDGTTMTESAAMLLHLAEQYPQANLLPPAASSERATVYRWLFFAACNIYESLLRLHYADMFTSDPATTEPVQVAARTQIDNSWALVENAMAVTSSATNSDA